MRPGGGINCLNKFGVKQRIGLPELEKYGHSSVRIKRMNFENKTQRCSFEFRLEINN